MNTTTRVDTPLAPPAPAKKRPSPTRRSAYPNFGECSLIVAAILVGYAGLLHLANPQHFQSSLGRARSEIAIRLFKAEKEQDMLDLISRRERERDALERANDLAAAPDVAELARLRSASDLVVAGNDAATIRVTGDALSPMYLYYMGRTCSPLPPERTAMRSVFDEAPVWEAPPPEIEIVVPPSGS